MTDPGRTVILGAGPTGLGAAIRLQELGSDDFELLEAKGHPGGLAASYLDAEGFTWDVGGHVQFSHYDAYDRAVDDALGEDGWLEHRRSSWIWLKERFVPYPFQYNLQALPSADRERALRGLEEAGRQPAGAVASDFAEWIRASFGEGMSQMFMIPYNEKVWGYPLEHLGVGWMGERVAAPDLQRVRRGLESERPDDTWGPNRSFRFPREGGTGAIWRAVARLIHPRHLRFKATVSRVDLNRRALSLDSGEVVHYDTLVTSLPLDTLCRLCVGLDSGAQRAAESLVHSSCHILGIGLLGRRPAALDKKCWMYFPESHSPYYRVTVFSNYSPANVPAGEGYWSLMAEVCETPHRTVDVEILRTWCLSAMEKDGLIDEHSEVVSFWHQREEHGYPTPFLEREAALDAILPTLEEHGVYSRGRFGAWKYEVSNQDHCFMQGVEVVDRVHGLGEELTLERPDYVNSGALRAG